MAWIWVPDAPTCLSEPAVWELAEEVQEQQRMAEAVGCVHQLLLVLLQITPGECPWGSCPDLGSACSRCSASMRHADVRQRPRSRAGRGSSQPCPPRSSALKQRHSTISLTAAAQKGVKHKSRGSLLVFLNLTVDINRCSGMKNGPKWELEEKDYPGALGIFPKSKGAQSTGREFKSY